MAMQDGGGVCHMTAWSTDGFGHQLAAALSCEAVALAFPSRFQYVLSRHAAVEHAPPDAPALLALLNPPGDTDGASMGPSYSPPVEVPPPARGGKRT